MKKTLVVLLILAVAGGVFAQEFTWTGGVKIGGWLDLHSKDGGKSDPPPSYAPDVEDERAHATVTLNYDNEGFHAELEFSGNFEKDDPHKPTPAEWTADGSLSATASYDAEDWMIQLGFGGLQSGDVTVDSLWGYWYLMNQKIKLDIAYLGWDEVYWQVSDIVDDNDWDNLDGIGGFRLNILPVDGLSFGFMFPGRHIDDDGTTVIPGYPVNTVDFLPSFFWNFVFGIKFEKEDKFAFGLMYEHADLSAEAQKAVLMAQFHLGDSLLIGAEVAGYNLGGFGDAGQLSFGAQLEYNAAPMTFGVYAKLLHFGIYKDSKEGDIVLNPYMLVEAIEDTLLVKFDLVFKMGDTSQDTSKGQDWGPGFGTGYRFSDEFNQLYITPSVFWNPMGDGIDDDPDKALIFQLSWGFQDILRASATMETKLYVGFCWAF